MMLDIKRYVATKAPYLNFRLRPPCTRLKSLPKNTLNVDMYAASNNNNNKKIKNNILKSILVPLYNYN